MLGKKKEKWFKVPSPPPFSSSSSSPLLSTFVLVWVVEGREVPAAQPPAGFASLSAFVGQENQPGVVAGPEIPALRRQRQEDCMLGTNRHYTRDRA